LQTQIPGSEKDNLASRLLRGQCHIQGPHKFSQSWQPSRRALCPAALCWLPVSLRPSVTAPYSQGPHRPPHGSNLGDFPWKSGLGRGPWRGSCLVTGPLGAPSVLGPQHPQLLQGHNYSRWELLVILALIPLTCAIFFFLSALGFELGTSCLQIRRSTT
jgi:hypothetical protein